jgi:hypothetical protein
MTSARRSLLTLLAAITLLLPDALGMAADDLLPTRSPPAVGSPFGDLVLPDIRTGEPVDLASFRGKKVLLIEFASW